MRGCLQGKIRSAGIIDKLKLSILDFQNKEMIGDTWSPTASMSNLNYVLADAFNHKAIVYQLDFIGAFLKANVKHIVFVKLDSRYGEYLPEYINYFGIPLRLKKSMYGMTNSGKLFSDELANWLIDEAVFKQSHFQMSIYYKYAPDGSKLVVLSYVDDCLLVYI